MKKLLGGSVSLFLALVFFATSINGSEFRAGFLMVQDMHKEYQDCLSVLFSKRVDKRKVVNVYARALNLRAKMRAYQTTSCKMSENFLGITVGSGSKKMQRQFSVWDREQNSFYKCIESIRYKVGLLIGFLEKTPSYRTFLSSSNPAAVELFQEKRLAFYQQIVEPAIVGLADVADYNEKVLSGRIQDKKWSLARDKTWFLLYWMLQYGEFLFEREKGGISLETKEQFELFGQLQERIVLLSKKFFEKRR